MAVVVVVLVHYSKIQRGWKLCGGGEGRERTQVTAVRQEEGNGLTVCLANVNQFEC